MVTAQVGAARRPQHANLQSMFRIREVVPGEDDLAGAIGEGVQIERRALAAVQSDLGPTAPRPLGRHPGDLSQWHRLTPTLSPRWLAWVDATAAQIQGVPSGGRRAGRDPCAIVCGIDALQSCESSGNGDAQTIAIMPQVRSCELASVGRTVASHLGYAQYAPNASLWQCCCLQCSRAPVCNRRGHALSSIVSTSFRSVVLHSTSASLWTPMQAWVSPRTRRTLDSELIL